MWVDWVEPRLGAAWDVVFADSTSYPFHDLMRPRKFWAWVPDTEEFVGI